MVDDESFGKVITKLLLLITMKFVCLVGHWSFFPRYWERRLGLCNFHRVFMFLLPGDSKQIRPWTASFHWVLSIEACQQTMQYLRLASEELLVNTIGFLGFCKGRTLDVLIYSLLATPRTFFRQSSETVSVIIFILRAFFTVKCRMKNHFTFLSLHSPKAIHLQNGINKLAFTLLSCIIIYGMPHNYEAHSLHINSLWS